MKFPSIEAGSEFADPLKGYIHFFATQDVHGQMHVRRDKLLNGTSAPLERVGRLIGQGCLSLTGRPNPHQAKTRLKQAKTELKQIETDKGHKFTMLTQQRNMLWHIASMLDMRNQPASVDAARSAMHATTIESLKHARRRVGKTKDAGEKSRASGSMAESAALALLTRYKHPWMLALPALNHHDQSNDSSSNFDIVLMEGGPAFSVPVAHKIQVKRECLGLCKDDSQEPAKYTDRYQHDICLVSGCCDLGITIDKAGGYNLSTLTLLEREYADCASTENITQLDHLTNNLLFAVTSDPRRRGLITPKV